LKFLASGFSGTNSFGRLLWGYIFDKIGFKKILIPGNIILLIISIFFYNSVDNNFLYGFFIVLTGFIMGSFYSIFPAYTSQKFGIKLSSEIYGLIFIGFGIANLLGPTFFFIIKKYLNLATFVPFKYAYFFGGCCQLISLIICFFSPKKEDKIII
jgi:MFS family permease